MQGFNICFHDPATDVVIGGCIVKRNPNTKLYSPAKQTAMRGLVSGDRPLLSSSFETPGYVWA